MADAPRLNILVSYPYLKPDVIEELKKIVRPLHRSRRC
jgi:hypothetical protein